MDDSKPKPVLPALFQHAGGFRDALLVGIGLVYALGLLTCSYSALKGHIGFVNALEPQYLIAGIIPSIPVLLLAFLFYTSLAFQDRVRELIRNVVIFGCLTLAILLVLFATAYAVWTNQQITRFDVGTVEVWISVIKMAWYGSIMLLALSLLRWLPGITREDRASDFYYNAFTRASLVTSIVVLFFLCNKEYAGKVFPNMPAEIGGGQPRCASLDVEKKKLTQWTAKALNRGAVPLDIVAREANENLESHSMLHLENVLIVYSSDKTVLLKLSAQKGADTFEIARSAVSVVTWCSISQAGSMAEENARARSECRCKSQ